MKQRFCRINPSIILNFQDFLSIYVLCLMERKSEELGALRGSGTIGKEYLVDI